MIKIELNQEPPNVAVLTEKTVLDYLRKIKKMNDLKAEIEATEAEFEAHFKATGELTICNVLQVTLTKTPPKLVCSKNGKVTDDMRQKLISELRGTDFVKSSESLEQKKIHEAKLTDKVVKKALKVCGLDTEQTEKIGFDRLMRVKNALNLRKALSLPKIVSH